MPDRPNRLCICGHRELEHTTAFKVGPTLDPGSVCGVRIEISEFVKRLCRCKRFRPALGEPNLEDLTI